MSEILLRREMTVVVVAAALVASTAMGQTFLPVEEGDVQPVRVQVQRLVEAMEYTGATGRVCVCRRGCTRPSTAAGRRT